MLFGRDCCWLLLGLTTQSAKEAADIVAMKSQIDSWNNQYNNSNNAAVNLSLIHI